MTEQKKKAGRPSKYGDPATAKRIKGKLSVLSEMSKRLQAEAVRKDLSPAQREAAQQLSMAYEVLINLTALKDLVDKYAEVDLAEVISKNPPIAFALVMRANSINDLASVGYDASIRAMVEKVIQDQRLLANRGNLIPTARGTVKTVVKEIAIEILEKYKGVEPKGFIEKIQIQYTKRFPDKKEPDSRTIKSYLK